MSVDKKRQRATKRRLKRARRERVFGGFLLPSVIGLFVLVVGGVYLNHYVISKQDTDLTVTELRSYVANNKTRYEVRDETGKLYYVEGVNRVSEYTQLVRGQPYHCAVRGIDKKLPLWPDFHAQITHCEPVVSS